MCSCERHQSIQAIKKTPHKTFKIKGPLSQQCVKTFKEKRLSLDLYTVHANFEFWKKLEQGLNFCLNEYKHDVCAISKCGMPVGGKT